LPQSYTANLQDSAEGVNVEAFLSVLAPEFACERLSGTSNTATAITAKVAAFTVSTNASGNVCVSITPECIFGAGTGTYAFVNIFKDATLDPLTGV
jgi:hypothetical protein